MMKIKKWLLLIFVSLLFGCASNSEGLGRYTEWDFEHQLQFTVNKMSEKHYLLTIASNKFKAKNGRKGKVKNFDRAAALLLRKSLQLCKNYDYQLTIVDGVEGFYDAQDRPNLLITALSAQLHCK